MLFEALVHGVVVVNDWRVGALAGDDENTGRSWLVLGDSRPLSASAVPHVLGT